MAKVASARADRIAGIVLCVPNSLTRSTHVLVVLDGWGHREEASGNAISLAQTPCYDRLWREYPHALLGASGEDVGLPEGQMGNSEVGHLTIGAGRLLLQSLPRIDNEIYNNGLVSNVAISETMASVADSGGRMHLWGLVSAGGVHSHTRHFVALIQLARLLNVRHLSVHAVLDGRDTSPRSAKPQLEILEDTLASNGYEPIADICGRYWAMDRDKRWDRTEKAWNLYRHGVGESCESALDGLQSSYEGETSDEFVLPHKTPSFSSWQDKDALLFVNFRPDRARQLAQIATEKNFTHVDRGSTPQMQVVTMTSYQEDLPVKVAFSPLRVSQSLGEVVSKAGFKQLRAAETEKYAHVTYFLNGGVEKPWKDEQRHLVPSPKVSTYDLQPEMSAVELTDYLVAAIASGEQDLIVCNYANGDMVGHTGKMDAAIKAVEVLDACLARLEGAVLQNRGRMLITADHGNCEQMSSKEQVGTAHTAHTSNPVPLILVGDSGVGLAETGGLADISPTLLEMMGLSIPQLMQGKSLVRD